MYIMVFEVAMAVRAGQSLVYRNLSGGRSDDKGRGARSGKESNAAGDEKVSGTICLPIMVPGTFSSPKTLEIRVLLG